MTEEVPQEQIRGSNKMSKRNKRLKKPGKVTKGKIASTTRHNKENAKFPAGRPLKFEDVINSQIFMLRDRALRLKQMMRQYERDPVMHTALGIGIRIYNRQIRMLHGKIKSPEKVEETILRQNWKKGHYFSGGMNSMAINA